MCLKLVGTFFAISIVICSISIGIFLRSSPAINATQVAVEWEKLEWSSDKSKDTSIRPFRIKFEKEVIEDLKQRLEKTRLNEPLEGIQQQYGMNTIFLKEFLDYWRTKYNFTEREQVLNRYPQFKTKIQGLDIHFVHVKPNLPKDSKKKVLPMLMLHGWPQAVSEFAVLIPLLTTPREEYDFVFELVMPSLPGFGFSQGSSKPGMGPAQMAVVFKLLMNRIGFEQFYTQGGDFGAVTIQAMGRLYPNSVLGIHSQLCVIKTKFSLMKDIFIGLSPELFYPKELIPKLYPISKRLKNLYLETGYFHLQATKPDTIGVALGDSPAGLAAYMLEKISVGTNVTFRNKFDGGLKEKYSYETLLDILMYYWLNNAGTTSVRIYAEMISANYFAVGLDNVPIIPPSACTYFVNEITYQNEWILKEIYHNLVHWQAYPFGGHFADMEVPEPLADDIFVAFEKILKFWEKH